MRFTLAISSALLLSGAIGAPNPLPAAVTTEVKPRSLGLAWPSNQWMNWKTFKGNGANLGGWLEKEQTHDPIWWNSINADAPDEWTLCESLGAQCGWIFESRYASFLNFTTIDALAAMGVNVLRVPTTYAAWISVPGSELYHGAQQFWLKLITDYAIYRYDMHIIIGLHSLPGGVNSLDIGEALGHGGWLYNTTNLAYSYQAVDAVLSYIKLSGHPQSYTFAPINEPSDNLAGFGTSASLSDTAAAWITDYLNGVLAKIAKVDKRIPMMIQDAFKGAAYWSPSFNSSANIVFDSHLYYFAIPGTTSESVLPIICSQATSVVANTTFPVFVGEWALQVLNNNTFAGRKAIFDTQRVAWQKKAAGGSFWTAVSYASAAVDGEGIQRDYWSYIDLIRNGVATVNPTSSYC